MRVLIVDDEAPARSRLQRLISEVPGCECVAEAHNGEQALSLSEEHAPDVVLMDIRMPGMSGVEAARHLAAIERPPAVIFTTAYDEYALEAFEAQAVGYLLKPVRRERLEKALHHAARPTRAQLSQLSSGRRPEARTHISARVADRLRLVAVEQVVYFRADQKYVCVRHTEGEVLIDEALKSLEQEFEGVFLRIHRNALVSLRHLDAVERCDDGQYLARLRGCDETLSVSRRLAASLRRKLRGRS